MSPRRKALRGHAPLVRGHRRPQMSPQCPLTHRRMSPLRAQMSPRCPLTHRRMSPPRIQMSPPMSPLPLPMSSQSSPPTSRPTRTRCRRDRRRLTPSPPSSTRFSPASSVRRSRSCAACLGATARRPTTARRPGCPRSAFPARPPTASGCSSTRAFCNSTSMD